MDLSDFMEIKEEKREKVLLIDANNLSMRCLYVAAVPGKKRIDELSNTDLKSIDQYGFIPQVFKRTVLMSIRKICRQFRPNRIIFCQEGFNNWRKEAFETYKSNRAVNREESAIDFNQFFAICNEFYEGLSKCMKNSLFLKVNRLEADDLIALTTKLRQDWDIVALTTDKDFYQLHKYSNFKQYDPIKEKYITVINPKEALLEKIVLGDKGDDVPPLKKGVGPKTFQKILSDGLDAWIDNNELREAFERNTKLISFDCIPVEFNSSVSNILDNWKPELFDSREFYNFIANNGLGAIFEELETFINIFAEVKSEN